MSGGWKDKLSRWSPAWSPPMYRFVLGTMLVLAFVIPLAIVAVPFIEFLNGMAAQPKAKSQMTYGRTFGEELPVLRSEPPGAVRREYRAPLFGPGSNKIEDAQAIGAKVVNPMPVTMENLERGRNRYEIYCIACHGRTAESNGPVVGPNRFPAPPSLHTDQARGYADGTICYVITNGVGKMPAYAGQIEPDDRWKVVLYVRALQRAQNPKPEDYQR
jgi:mono/diheme cytochrome c family protein